MNLLNTDSFGVHEDTTPTPTGSGPFFQSGLVSDETLYEVRMFSETYIKMSICVAGVATNIINIAIFVQIGLKDSVTISFLGLAVADLGFLLFTLMYQLLENLDVIFGLKPEVNLLHLSYILNAYSFMFVDISVAVTVFTALQKCACVAVPFIFKKASTRFRSAVAIVTIYATLLIDYFPFFLTSVLTPEIDIVNNRTIFIYIPSPLQNEIFVFHAVFNRMALPAASMFFVTASLIIMRIKLVQASRLRQSMTKYKGDPTTGAKRAKGRNYMSLNEVRAIQAVFVVSAIFVGCNLPDMISYSTIFPVKDFHSVANSSQAYRLTRALQNVLVVASATVNIGVYLTYNTKYRNQFFADFRDMS